jgi:uncharacterized SAM-binding protein YcdF (DUF218 family)
MTLSAVGALRAPGLLRGGTLGLALGLLASDLNLGAMFSMWGDSTPVVMIAGALGALLGLLPVRPWVQGVRTAVGAVTFALVLLWLLVVVTPLTGVVLKPLCRRDPLVRADAIFVLRYHLQADGEPTTPAMSRLLHGLELVGQGWAPRLVLSEISLAHPHYTRLARHWMETLGRPIELETVGPIFNTHDEAVRLAELARRRGWHRIIVVTSPSHSRRASAAIERQGLQVVASPALETRYDVQQLRRGDDRVRALGSLLHEWVGLAVYRYRGWL